MPAAAEPPAAEAAAAIDVRQTLQKALALLQSSPSEVETPAIVAQALREVRGDRDSGWQREFTLTRPSNPGKIPRVTAQLLGGEKGAIRPAAAEILQTADKLLIAAAPSAAETSRTWKTTGLATANTWPGDWAFAAASRLQTTAFAHISAETLAVCTGTLEAQRTALAAPLPPGFDDAPAATLVTQLLQAAAAVGSEQHFAWLNHLWKALTGLLQNVPPPSGESNLGRAVDSVVAHVARELRHSLEQACAEGPAGAQTQKVVTLHRFYMSQLVALLRSHVGCRLFATSDAAAALARLFVDCISPLDSSPWLQKSLGTAADSALLAAWGNRHAATHDKIRLAAAAVDAAAAQRRMATARHVFALAARRIDRLGDVAAQIALVDAIFATDGSLSLSRVSADSDTDAHETLLVALVGMTHVAAPRAMAAIERKLLQRLLSDAGCDTCAVLVLDWLTYIGGQVASSTLATYLELLAGAAVALYTAGRPLAQDHALLCAIRRLEHVAAARGIVQMPVPARLDPIAYGNLGLLPSSAAVAPSIADAARAVDATWPTGDADAGQRVAAWLESLGDAGAPPAVRLEEIVTALATLQLACDSESFVRQIHTALAGLPVGLEHARAALEAFLGCAHRSQSLQPLDPGLCDALLWAANAVAIRGPSPAHAIAVAALVDRNWAHRPDAPRQLWSLAQQLAGNQVPPWYLQARAGRPAVDGEPLNSGSAPLQSSTGFHVTLRELLQAARTERRLAVLAAADRAFT